MDQNLNRHASHRTTGVAVSVGQVADPSAIPGQNERFSDGFLTKSPVVTCHSGQPEKFTDPTNPMKSQETPPCQGLPADLPSPQSCLQGWGDGV